MSVSVRLSTYAAIASSGIKTFLSALANRLYASIKLFLLSGGPKHEPSTRAIRKVAMRLANFILHDLEVILQEWENFAATLFPAGQPMGKVALRDHVKKMLETIAADLCQAQTEREETEKSKGHHDSPANRKTAVATHGKERLDLGFSLDAAMAEYRVLRASVTRLWQKSLANKPLPDTAMGDLIWFNEAIDQSINESVTSYSFEKEQQMRVFDTILSTSPDLSFTLNLEGKFAYVNKALFELIELPPDKIIGKNYRELNFPNGIELQRQIDLVIKSKKQFRGEMLYSSPSGRRGFYDYIYVPVLNNKGDVEMIAGTARNITERKAMEDQNWQRANYDLLTGLPNRRLFLDRLEQDVKHADRIGAQLALLFIDLDHFKEANDGFGHDAGDLLLRVASTRIRACVRETDTVARLGGDEFTVILQDLEGSEHAEMVAAKIISELAMPFQIFNDSVQISASIGITLSPQDATTPEQLLKNADRAMYMAKNAGRNQFSFFGHTQARTNTSLQKDRRTSQKDRRDVSQARKPSGKQPGV